MSTVTTISSREFNQNTGNAKRAAAKGPVFITDRGRPSHVLLTISEYRRISSAHKTLAEALAESATDPDLEFEAPRLGPGIFKPAGARLGVAKGRFVVPADIDASNAEVAALFGTPGD